MKKREQACGQTLPAGRTSTTVVRIKASKSTLLSLKQEDVETSLDHEEGKELHLPFSRQENMPPFLRGYLKPLESQSYSSFNSLSWIPHPVPPALWGRAREAAAFRAAQPALPCTSRGGCQAKWERLWSGSKAQSLAFLRKHQGTTGVCVSQAQISQLSDRYKITLLHHKINYHRTFRARRDIPGPLAEYWQGEGAEEKKLINFKS